MRIALGHPKIKLDAGAFHIKAKTGFCWNLCFLQLCGRRFGGEQDPLRNVGADHITTVDGTGTSETS
jgi:hypothetical protein